MSFFFVYLPAALIASLCEAFVHWWLKPVARRGGDNGKFVYDRRRRAHA